MTEHEWEHLNRIRAYLPECTVLLKSDGSFPVDTPCNAALYGAGARGTIKGGTGSGEVNSRFFVNIEEGLKERGFTVTTAGTGGWLDRYETVRKAAHRRFVKSVKERAAKKHTNPVMESMGVIMPQPEYDLPLDGTGDIAVYVVSRISGEGADREYIKGDILLNDSEVRDILSLNKAFTRFLLVLNTGGPIDLTPVMEVKNILLLSQLGVETGTVLADIILGRSYPSGKLATTWSTEDGYCSEGDFGCINDTCYREGIYVGYRYFDTVGKAPLFPFGYGLGFTTFELRNPELEVDGSKVRVRADVLNTGGRPGKETVQLYVSVPEGKLDQPCQMLAAFAKSEEIEPGGAGTVELFFDITDIASYSGADSAYILEGGSYILRLGTSSRDTKVIGIIKLDKTVTVRRVRNVLGDPGFTDYKPVRINGADTVCDDVSTVNIDPGAIRCTDAVYGTSADTDISKVKDLSDEELIYLAIGSFDPGAGIMSVIGNAGKTVAGAAGQTTHILEDKGIKSYVMADGPAGIRLSREYFIRDGQVYSMALPIPETMQAFLPLPARIFIKMHAPKPRKGEEIRHQYCTAMPIGTAIAQSWNTEFATVCGDIAGDEMEMFGVDLWLAPALNIHRDIRCGRNFEYYSEDPLISGVMASCITQGVQAHKGRGTTIKHFAANNQETNRYRSNSRVSERAMREIYLKGFEICVKRSQPAAVMTSYNLLNGVHTSESRSLIEDILRDEFGFKGIVMTDWVVAMNITDKDSVYPDPQPCNVIMAGGDLFMPGCKGDYDSVSKALADGTVTREQLMINAARIIRGLSQKE